MAWSKLEDSFRDNRKPKRMARALGIRRAEARGLMAGLWSWATTQAPDGDLTDHTPDEIEEAMDWEGAPGEAILAALDVGLLDGSNVNSVEAIHKWMKRAGSFRKAKQKQKERKVGKDKERRSRDQGAPQSKSVAGEKRREEKRREETTEDATSSSESKPKQPDRSPRGAADVNELSALLANLGWRIFLTPKQKVEAERLVPITPDEMTSAIEQTQSAPGRPNAGLMLSIVAREREAASRAVQKGSEAEAAIGREKELRAKERASRRGDPGRNDEQRVDFAEIKRQLGVEHLGDLVGSVEEKSG